MMKDVDLKNTTIIGSNLPAEIRKLKEERGKEIILFGSPTLAQTLMQEDLIDDYWLFVNPILLGQGIPLFKGLTKEIRLKHLLSKIFASGVVCLHYEANRDK